MKLYFSPSACSLSPHIVLRESGLPFELEQVDIHGDHKTKSGKDFYAINPKGYVPTLELDDGSVLTEGPAIVQLIADKAADKKLAPENGTVARAHLQEMLNFISTEIHKGYGPLFNKQTPDDQKKAAREKLGKKFDLLEKDLGAKPYLFGEGFTVADAYLFTVLRWTSMTGIDLAKWPKLQAFVGRVNERPAVKSALAAEAQK